MYIHMHMDRWIIDTALGIGSTRSKWGPIWWALCTNYQNLFFIKYNNWSLWCSASFLFFGKNLLGNAPNIITNWTYIALEACVQVFNKRRDLAGVVLGLLFNLFFFFFWRWISIQFVNSKYYYIFSFLEWNGWSTSNFLDVLLIVGYSNIWIQFS